MLWEAHVDYLRISIPADASAVDRQRMADLRERARNSQGGRYEEAHWAWNGYVGLKVGAAQWGTRGDGEYLQVSGQDASCVVGASLPDRFKCSRLDLAVTVLMQQDQARLAEETFRRLNAGSADRDVSHARRIVVVLNPGGGDTLYIGSRTSRAYARVYDKGRESKGQYPLGTWRYELEAHNEQSTRYLPMVIEPATSVAACAGLVKDWLEKRGVSVPVEAGPGVDSSLPSPKISRDDWRRLQWLEKQVAPGLPELIDRVGPAAVYSALGLNFAAHKCVERFSV